MKAKQIPKRVGLVAQVLQFVNALRTESGLKALKTMPRGVCGDPRECPIARGINHGAVVSSRIRIKEWDVANAFMRGAKKQGTHLTLTDTGFDSVIGYRYEVSLPKYAKEFIESFDAGRIPQLLATGETGE